MIIFNLQIQDVFKEEVAYLIQTVMDEYNSSGIMREGTFQGKCISKGMKIQEDGVCLSRSKNAGIVIVAAHSSVPPYVLWVHLWYQLQLQ